MPCVTRASPLESGDTSVLKSCYSINGCRVFRRESTFNPQKRTWLSTVVMSALCQKRTSRLYSVASRWRRPLHRREFGHRAHPGGELRAAGSEIAEAAFARNIKSHGEN